MVKISFEEIESLPVTHSATVPEEWLDMMGHMNVMWYTHLFSEATRNFFPTLGLTEEYMKKNQSGAFALECHIQYLKELHVGNQLHTRSCIVSRSEKRFSLMHFIVNEDEQTISAIGQFKSAHIDMTKRRMSSLPEEVTKIFDEQIADHEARGWDLSLCDKINS